MISDQTQSIPRSAYDLSAGAQPAHTRSANATEKDARAATYAAVKRALGPGTADIVLLDGLNYIKGWRYQLFCEAKNAGTGSCVLQVGCGVQRARSVNEERLERRARRERGEEAGEGAEDDEEPYEPDNWENLVFRYEEPNAMMKWDSPLFTLIWEDDEARTKEVFDDLWETIAGKWTKVVRANQVTVDKNKDFGGDYLYILERETQEIVKRILELQGDEGGGRVVLPRSALDVGDELVVELPGKKVGLPQLQRYRRAFVALSRGGVGLDTVDDVGRAVRLRETFVGYLNDAFEKED